jgi:type III secretion system HrpB4-like protein
MSADLPFVRTAWALKAHSRNLTDAARWMHPSWIKRWLELDDAQFEVWAAAVARASDQAVRDVSLALSGCAGIAAAPFAHALPEPALSNGSQGLLPDHRLLDVCAPSVGLQILRMRALWFRRAEARRIIDKRMRTQLSAWIGLRLDTLLGRPDADDPPDMAILQIRCGAPALAELDAQALCAEGLAMIGRDAGAGSGESMSTLKYALPDSLSPPAWWEAVNPDADKWGTVSLFERLPELLSEWKWLFG